MQKTITTIIVIALLPLILPLSLAFSIYKCFKEVKIVVNDVEEIVESGVIEETPARKKRADRSGIYRRSFNVEETPARKKRADRSGIYRRSFKEEAIFDKMHSEYDEMNAEYDEMNAVFDKMHNILYKKIEKRVTKPNTILKRADRVKNDTLTPNKPIQPADMVVDVSNEHSIDLRKHTLIAGRSGSGKSVALNTMIKQLQKNDNIDIVVLDPKRVSFNGFEGIDVIKDLDSMQETLRDIKLEMELRYELMDNMNLDKFNSECGFKSKVLIIDETSRLFNGVDIKLNKENIALVTELIELGRACDISIIVATQTPSRKNIPTNIQNNIANVLCFEVKDASASRAVFDEKNDAHTINNNPGEFRLKSADAREIVSGMGLML